MTNANTQPTKPVTMDGQAIERECLGGPGDGYTPAEPSGRLEKRVMAEPTWHVRLNLAVAIDAGRFYGGSEKMAATVAGHLAANVRALLTLHGYVVESFECVPVVAVAS